MSLINREWRQAKYDAASRQIRTIVVEATLDCVTSFLVTPVSSRCSPSPSSREISFSVCVCCLSSASPWSLPPPTYKYLIRNLPFFPVNIFFCQFNLIWLNGLKYISQGNFFYIMYMHKVRVSFMGGGWPLGNILPPPPENCIIKIIIDVDKCLTKCMSSESMHM